MGQMRGQTIDDPAINMQLMPLQVNSSQHAQGKSHLYSNEFHVQNIGAKKIVQLNTLSSDHDRKPVGEEVMAEKQEQQQQLDQPLKVELSLPELPEQQELLQLPENNVAEGAETEQDTDTIKKPDPTPLTVPGAETPTSVKKTMDPSGTIIDMASTGMQELVSQSTGQNADDTNTKASNGKKRPQEAKVRPARPKTRRKQTSTGTRTSNETDTKMTASQPSNTAATPAPVLSPILKPKPGPGSAREPMKELEAQSPEISTHRPLATKSKSKSKSKGKGKNKRRQDASQRRPVGGAMGEEIETTTNWWQILPYAEIRKFLNTIYDTIADDVDDERATDDV